MEFAIEYYNSLKDESTGYKVEYRLWNKLSDLLVVDDDSIVAANIDYIETKTGIEIEHLIALANGKEIPTLTESVKLSTFFNCDIEDLFKLSLPCIKNAYVIPAKTHVPLTINELRDLLDICN